MKIDVKRTVSDYIRKGNKSETTLLIESRGNSLNNKITKAEIKEEAAFAQLKFEMLVSELIKKHIS